MTNEEYIECKNKGREIFSDDIHEDNICKIMNESWNEIKTFSNQKYTDIKACQLKRISELVDYAYINIPLYRKKYDEIGYKVGDIKTWEDYDKLPILYKEELIEGFPNDISKQVEDFYLSTRSSGSSGKFVTLAVSKKAIYEDTIQGFRQYYIQTNEKYNKKDIVLFIYTCPWWIESVHGLYKSEFLPTITPINQAIEKIIEIKPKIISTYPTYLEKIASKNIDLGELGVETVIIHSEQSNKLQRKLLSEKLNVMVLDEYSSEELTRIALECPHHNYHLEEDACYVETINPQTFCKCKNGEPGIIVGTNLLNTGTPIIKYWQGDLAILDSPINCKCGSNCRTMKEISGRYMDSVKTLNGDIIPASAFMDIAYNWFLNFDIPVHGLRYQFVQNSLDTLNLYLIVAKFSIDLDKIRESIYLLIPASMTLIIECVKEFPFKMQKYRPLINNIGGK